MDDSEIVLKKTPLYDIHVKYGAKIIPFAGWEMPVQYKAGVVDEHMAVRTGAGLFDISHMGEISIKGKDSLDFINYLLTNDYSDIEDGQARYSPMCNEKGGCVDDVIVYKKGQDDYLMVVNAANKDKDFAWINSHKPDDIQADVEDISDSVAQIAVQGPDAISIVEKICKAEDIPENYYYACFDRDILGFDCIISRTGYTGEDGVEIYCPPEAAAPVWEKLIEVSEGKLIPCGLGARDTLRLEAGMPLYGHEMNDEISPREAGLGMFVKLEKEADFIGKDALVKAGDPKRGKIGLKVTGRGIVREGQDVYKDGKKVGVTCSGTFLPFLKGAYATALVDAGVRELGSVYEVDVRGRRVECEQVKSRFYKRA